MSAIKDLEFSDLFLEDGDNRYRQESQLYPLSEEHWEEAETLRKLCESKAAEGAVEFSVKHDGVTYRCVAFEHEAGFHVTLRRLANKIYTWKELRLPPTLLEVILSMQARPNLSKDVVKRGIVLVLGESDSGKSTTTNALIHEICHRKSWFTMCLEDPIEVSFSQYRYETGAKVIQREMPSSEFSLGLKQALRANADVVKIGEIRDSDAARVAVDAALSGHMVFATLHAGTIDEGLRRFSQMLGEDANTLLAGAIRCCLHQSLEKGHGLRARIMQMQCLITTPSVKNLIQDGNFRGLQQSIETQTKNYFVNGGGGAELVL